MARIIAVPKGGAGKTSTTLNLGAALAARGHRVLLIDFDPQGNLSLSLRVTPGKPSLYTVTREFIATWEPHLDRVILPSTIPNVDVAPTDVWQYRKRNAVRRRPAAEAAGSWLTKAACAASGRPRRRPSQHHSPPVYGPGTCRVTAFLLRYCDVWLNEADEELRGADRREYVLQKLLEPVAPAYDFVIIDTLPYFGMLVKNALVAADELIIPMQAEFLATQSIEMMLKLVERIQRSGLNPLLRVLGVLVTQVDIRTNMGRQAESYARAEFLGRVPIFTATDYFIRAATSRRSTDSEPGIRVRTVPVGRWCGFSSQSRAGPPSNSKPRSETGSPLGPYSIRITLPR
ncbi:ParA family protein [Chloroflexales bacterium ZM16-3]|nr:ParA family protein [Chloroflexales bacterium ZM16-3]